MRYNNTKYLLSHIFIPYYYIYPSTTHCKRDIVKLLWFYQFVHLSIPTDIYEHINKTRCNHDEKMIPIDFGRQGSKFKNIGLGTRTGDATLCIALVLF